MATSENGGKTWSGDRPAYKAAPSANAATRPSVAYDHAGSLVVMFRNALAGA
ncbi:MAG TPA: hypothetical protein VGN72_23965 [Tepidisphaeraceae bacterium]|jgi:hypothetical protein|nr:hypothetical protein [Tepidisphaeraceae bacterium]